MTQAIVIAWAIIPEGEVEPTHESIRVEWRGGDKWAVLVSGRCLARDGSFDFERLPSARTDGWLSEHRFSEEEALQQARKLVVSGKVPT